MPQAGREQRHQGEAQHDQRDRQVDEGHDAEDQHGREQGDQELRQELAEIGLELLDAVDHGKRERARALAADRAGPQRGDAVVERAAERLLHPRRRLVRHHGAPMLGGAAQHHDQGDQQHRRHELAERAAGEDLADQPAQQAQAGDAQPDGNKADGDGAGDPPAHALGEDQKTRFDVHGGDAKPNVNIRHSTIRKNRCTFLNMDANWDDLRVFLTLAREGTLTTAAKALGVSHPTVSRRVQALEQQIGARLFERLPDRFVPTSAGEELLADTEAMEKAALSIHRRSAGLSDTVSGVVRLSAGEAMAALIARHLAWLRERLRHIEFEVIASHTLANLSRREADLLIREQVPELAGIVVRKLGRVAYAVYAARDFALGRKGAIDGLPWIGFDDDHSYMPGQHWLLERLAGARPAVRCNNWLVLHEAARAGAGLAVLPCYLGDADPALKRVGGIVSDVFADQWLLVHRDLRALPRVRAVMDAVIELFQRERALLEGRS